MKRPPIPIFDADGAEVTEENYPGFDDVSGKFRNAFRLRSKGMIVENSDRSLEEIVMAAFLQGIVYATCSDKINEDK